MVANMIQDQGVSLRKALRVSRCSRRTYYYQTRKRTIPPNPYILAKVREEALKRPLYGTRRMAATLTRQLGRPINRKRIQRIYRYRGWIQPQKTKKQLLRAAYDRRPKPTRPNELWETDLTYIHCGIDGWALAQCYSVPARPHHKARPHRQRARRVLGCCQGSGTRGKIAG